MRGAVNISQLASPLTVAIIGLAVAAPNAVAERSTETGARSSPVASHSFAPEWSARRGLEDGVRDSLRFTVRGLSGKVTRARLVRPARLSSTRDYRLLVTTRGSRRVVARARSLAVDLAGRARSVNITRHVRGNGRLRLEVTRAGGRRALAASVGRCRLPTPEPITSAVAVTSPPRIALDWPSYNTACGVRDYYRVYVYRADGTLWGTEPTNSDPNQAATSAWNVDGLTPGARYAFAYTAVVRGSESPKSSRTSYVTYPSEPAPAPVPTAPTAPNYYWSMLGHQAEGISNVQMKSAGFDGQMYSLSWKRWFPTRGVRDETYVNRVKAQIAQLRTDGLKITLGLGYHDVPKWMHDFPNSWYVDQHGRRYTGGASTPSIPSGEVAAPDSGEANLVFNQELRIHLADYFTDVFRTLGVDFYAVRIGDGFYGEMHYPKHDWNGCSTCNSYWMFDAAANARRPFPNWRPGQPSPNGEAAAVVRWYLDQRADFAKWQFDKVRGAGYPGMVHMLLPGWGVRPGNVDQAIQANLNGTSPAERSGEMQQGTDWDRMVDRVADANLVPTTTWINAPKYYGATADEQPDPRWWTTAKYNAHIADTHEPPLKKYGENTGNDDRAQAVYSRDQMVKFRYDGIAWFRNGQLACRCNGWATIEDLRDVIATAP